MKAVVININKNKAVLVQSDSTFISVPNKGYVVGQEIYIKDSKNKIYRKLAKVTAAAAAFLLVIGIGFSYAYNIPRCYVSVDINPSIELQVNMFNQVINVNGVNDDGAAILEKMEIGHKSMERVIELIISQAKKEGYLTSDDEKAVIVAVQCDNQHKQDTVMESAKLQVNKSLKQLDISATVSVDLVSKQTIDDAHAMGTTAGKLDLIEDYIELSESDTQAVEFKDTPVQVLVKEIDDLKEDHDDNSDKEYSEKDDDEEKDKDKEKYKDRERDKDKDKKDKEHNEASYTEDNNNEDHDDNELDDAKEDGKDEKDNVDKPDEEETDNDDDDLDNDSDDEIDDDLEDDNDKENDDNLGDNDDDN